MPVEQQSESRLDAIVERYEPLKRLGDWRRKRRIPYIQQLSGTECGAACLSMVLGYFGRGVGLEKVRDAGGIGRDGLNAIQILDTANLMGLRGRGVKVEINQLHLLPAGATILHWEFNHFVVLAAVHRQWVEIVDPGFGPRRVPIEQFRKAFTGVALIFEPNDLFKREKRAGVVFKTIKELIIASGLLPRVIVISLVLQTFGLALPLLTGQLVDNVIPRADTSLLWILAIGVLLVVGLQAIAGLLRGNLLLHLRTVLDVRMTLGFLDHMVSLPYSYFQTRGGGDLMMRLNANSIVREHLTSAATSGLLDGIFVVVYFVVLVVGSVPMAVTALAAAAVDVLIYLAIRRRQRHLMSMGLDAQSKEQNYEVEMLTSMETLKATGNEHRAVSRWSDFFVDSTNLSLQRERLTMNVGVVVGVLSTLGPLAILIVGTSEVLRGNISIGAMLALNAVAHNFITPVSSLVRTFLSLEIVRGYLVRIGDVLEAEPEQDASKVRLAPRLTGAIDLEHVKFRYSSQGPLVINDVSLRIPPGQFVAIVGRSGSGKSTLANLMMGLYRPESGRILLDGTDTFELDLRSVRQQMGIVSQNFSLYGSTIRENIALSDPSLSLKAITRAARLAGIHDEILAMPMGYETLLVDRGGSISGGQKQRLALARALVRHPAILVLDEATSALDALTEAQVQRSLASLQCTRIVIAHRLSTIREANVILVVDEGCIKETGTHDELIEKGGFYARLLGSQIGGSDESPASDVYTEGSGPPFRP